MPHFAERDEKTNAFRQQDAHECWSAVISNLAQSLKMDTPQSQEVCTDLGEVRRKRIYTSKSERAKIDTVIFFSSILLWILYMYMYMIFIIYDKLLIT